MSIFRFYKTSSSEPSLYIFDDPEDRQENTVADLYSDDTDFDANNTHWQTQSEEKFLDALYMLASDETFCMTQASFRSILKTYVSWKAGQQ